MNDQLSTEQFKALFRNFRTSAFRLETLPAYDVGGDEAVRLNAFAEGELVPPRTVITSQWLRRIAMSVLTADKTWTRVRIVDTPPTDYQMFELTHSYREAQVVGDNTLLVPRVVVHDWRASDFWLFDADTPDVHVVVMTYDDEGRWLGAEFVKHNLVSRYEQLAHKIAELAVPFGRYVLAASHA